MNFNEFKEMHKTAPREVEYLFDGHRTGLYLTLLHESAQPVQEFMKTYNAKVRDLTIKRKTNAINNLAAQHALALNAVQVSDWRWEEGETEGRPAFSKQELKSMLKDPDVGFHLAAFIDQEVGSLSDFLSRSEQD